MATTDMVVFNSQLQSAVVEKLTQMSMAFNAASGNALVLMNANNMGDFKEESYWNNVASALRDVDVYAANGAASTLALSQDQINTVKAQKAFGPIIWEATQLAWIQKNESEALSVISTSLSQAMLQAQVNRAIGIGVAAIGNVAGATNDISASAPVTQNALNDTHALFGDQSTMITTQIMSGATYHKLIGNALDNSNQLFSEGTVTVIDILGKRTVVTDAPPLSAGGNNVLCLTPNAITVEPNGDYYQNIETSNGKERIESTFQAEWSENLGIKGYAWDIANGGKSPVTAELETGTNWDLKWNVKNSAGVLLKAQ